jgi:hypothetical protein
LFYFDGSQVFLGGGGGGGLGLAGGQGDEIFGVSMLIVDVGLSRALPSRLQAGLD